MMRPYEMVNQQALYILTDRTVPNRVPSVQKSELSWIAQHGSSALFGFVVENGNIQSKFDSFIQ